MDQIKKIIEAIKEPVLAMLVGLMITNFAAAHTKIPTGSMIDTINIGDHVIVNRIPFYYRDPVRGEIVVFNHEGTNLVKRVVGEPGDVINLIDGNVYVNGTALDESGYLYTLNSTYELYPSDITFPFTVPGDSYFVMGDNREISGDSRIFGSIKREQIFAKGGLKIYPFNSIGFIH